MKLKLIKTMSRENAVALVVRNSKARSREFKIARLLAVGSLRQIQPENQNSKGWQQFNNKTRLYTTIILDEVGSSTTWKQATRPRCALASLSRRDWVTLWELKEYALMLFQWPDAVCCPYRGIVWGLSNYIRWKLPMSMRFTGDKCVLLGSYIKSAWTIVTYLNPRTFSQCTLVSRWSCTLVSRSKALWCRTQKEQQCHWRNWVHSYAGLTIFSQTRRIHGQSNHCWPAFCCRQCRAPEGIGPDRRCCLGRSFGIRCHRLTAGMTRIYSMLLDFDDFWAVLNCGGTINWIFGEGKRAPSYAYDEVRATSTRENAIKRTAAILSRLDQTGRLGCVPAVSWRLGQAVVRRI